MGDIDNIVMDMERDENIKGILNHQIENLIFIRRPVGSNADFERSSGMIKIRDYVFDKFNSVMPGPEIVFKVNLRLEIYEQHNR